jgi:Ca2+-binding EF-hand superfamily protein
MIIKTAHGCCVPHQRAELLDWIQRFDHDRSNTLNFREFVDMMMEWKQQELRDMFELFDADASGSITTDELAEALPELGLYMSAANFEALLHNIDADGSGEISEAEFAQFLM